MTSLEQKRVLSYSGAKWTLAPWVLQHCAPHATYVEPYFGSGGVYFQKKPVRNEYLNDLSGEVVNFFKMLRDEPEKLIHSLECTPWSRAEYEAAFEFIAEPIERARRLAVR